jgi:hypothetical protein
MKQKEVSEVPTGRPIMSTECGQGLQTNKKNINSENCVNLMPFLIQRT